MARSRRDAKWVGLGVTSVNAVWIFGSLAGVTVLLTRVQVLYETIRISGAVYLLYLSFQMLRSTRRRGSPYRPPSSRPSPVRERPPGASGP
ncbi:LysE family transporter [Streptomyces sp. NPDC005813]|uniref:LysE family translocator n=1 Tax=Streptomyces sp. NPDC005813 TaxID=3155592 RepID=UPI0033C37DB1